MIAADPRDVELKFALAKFYVAGRQPEHAEKIYREVIDGEKLDAAGLAARDRLAALRASATTCRVRGSSSARCLPRARATMMR